MDLLDIILGKKLAAGTASTVLIQAQQAVQTANSATTTLDSLISQVEATKAIADNAASSATTAANTYDSLLASVDESILDTIDDDIAAMIVEEVNKMNIITATSIIDDNTNEAKIKKLRVTKNNVNTDTTAVKYYVSTGQNEDGGMTQKAISDQLTALENLINSSSGSGGDGASLNNSTPGQVVIAGNNNSIVASYITEDDLAEVLAKNGIYNIPNAVGLTIDYENKTFERVAEAKGKNSGNDFSLQKYPMYSKRVRCNVNNAGQITAIYGNNNYRDDGTNGDVMVLQPKFYYQRIPIKTNNNIKGKIVRKETIAICAEARPGFKLHPAFIDAAGNELEYILLPAYESCYYDASASTLIKNDSGTIDFNADYLFSCSNAKPVSGTSNALTLENAEKLAINKGNGWHITDIAAESANQMLALIEFGTLNSQAALESGLTNLPNTEGINCASQTGSTASLGNNTGNATETINITNNITNTYNTVGRRAISYRGMENPWGNIWRIIGGIKVIGNGSSGGGEPHIYSTRFDSTTIEGIGFTLPNSHSWVSALGYSEPKYDWILMPAEASNANSSLPVGDNVWINTNMSGTTVVLLGGPWMQQDNEGLFYYSCDNNINGYFRSASARIMHIPIYNSSAYAYNIQLINNMEV